MLRRLTALLDPETARAYRRRLLGAGAYAACEGLAFGLALPALAAVLDGTPSRWGWAAALAVAALATLVIRAWHTDRALRTTITTINVLHRRMATHLATLPVDWFAAVRTGSLVRTMWPGAADVTRNVLLSTAPLLRGVVTPAVIVVVTALVAPVTAAVMVAVVPLLWWAHRATSAAIVAAEARTHDAQAEATARILEFSEAQATLRASGRLGTGFRELADALDERDRVMRSGVGRELLARAGFGTAVQLSVAALAAAVCWWATGPDTSPAMLVALLVLVLRFAEPIAAVGEIARSMRVSAAAVGRIADLLETPPLPPPATPTPLPAGDTGLEVGFEAVTRRHGGAERAALDSFTLRVPAGTTTALVGASGAGKSTALRLVARFTDPDAGTVRLGGVDVRDLAPDDLYGALGVVLQDVVLLAGTVRDNVVLGRPGASAAELDAAAAAAGLDEVLARLPAGWATPVGVEGGGLSGGERQRVVLARVALQDAPVVLLDEATAALDAVNERVVARWVARLSGRRTLLMVAHRLHTVIDADRIVVLDRGDVVDAGTHPELLARCERYRALWDAHDAAAGWRLAR